MLRRKQQIQTANLAERCRALEEENTTLRKRNGELTQFLANFLDGAAPVPPPHRAASAAHQVPARLLAALNNVPAEGNIVRFHEGDREVIAVVDGNAEDPGLIWDYIQRAGGLAV